MITKLRRGCGGAMALIEGNYFYNQLVQGKQKNIIMKTKSYLKAILTPVFLISVLASSWSAVKIDVNKNSVQTKTDNLGVEGFAGCKKKAIKKRSAYIYDLFYEINSSNLNDRICIKKNRYKHLNRITSSSSEPIEFKNLKPGTYKIVAYYATPTGCDLSKVVDPKILKDHPTNSLIYQKEESKSFTITNPLDINEDISANQLKPFEVFPNPASDIVFVKLHGVPLKKGTELFVQSLVGGKIKKYPLPINVNQLNYKIDVSHYFSGTYLIYLNDKNGIQYQEKIVVLNY